MWPLQKYKLGKIREGEHDALPSGSTVERGRRILLEQVVVSAISVDENSRHESEVKRPDVRANQM